MTKTAEHLAIESTFFATREAFYNSMSAVAAKYSDAGWQRMGELEVFYHAARDALDRADKKLWS